MNSRPETIKFLEENISGNLTDTSLTNVLVDQTPKERETKAKNKHQTEKLLYSKGNHNQNKRQLTKWEKLFANHLSTTQQQEKTKQPNLKMGRESE